MSYIYFLALLNVVLAGVMLIYNWKLNRNIAHFSVYMLTISASSILFDTVLNGGLPSVLLYSSVFAESMSFLAGPALYLFVSGLVYDRNLYNRKYLLHLTPSVLSFLVLVPFLFKPAEEQMQFAVNSLGNMSYYMNSYLYVLPNWAHDIINIVMTYSYLIVALVVLNRQFYKKRSGLLSPIRSQYDRSRMWLNIILSVSLVLITLRVGLVLYFLTDPASYNALKNEHQFMISTTMITVLTLLVMFNPRLLYGFPQSRENEAKAETHPGESTPSSATVTDPDENLKENKAPVQNEYFTTLCNRILEEMEDSKPYLMPEFNVYHLTVSLDAPQHHIQFCINSIMNKNFADFKGEYRVKHAMELMKTDMHKRKTLASIGYESGFASASNFYSTFRDITGITPNQWLKEYS